MASAASDDEKIRRTAAEPSGGKMGFTKRNCQGCKGVQLGEAPIQSTFTLLALNSSACWRRAGDLRQKCASEHRNYEEVEMNGTKVLGLAAVGALVLALPIERASAVSLTNPGVAGTFQEDLRKLTTEAHWHYHHWHYHHWHHHHWRHHHWYHHHWHHRHWHHWH